MLILLLNCSQTNTQKDNINHHDREREREKDLRFDANIMWKIEVEAISIGITFVSQVSHPLNPKQASGSCEYMLQVDILLNAFPPHPNLKQKVYNRDFNSIT